jgi:hypothetical protein
VGAAIPGTIINFEIFGFLIGVGAIVAWKLLTGDINTHGLFDTGPQGTFSPARVQVLVANLGGAAWYLGLTMTNQDQSHMPDVPNDLLLLLGGSHVTYLGAKGADKLGWFRGILGFNQ